MSGLLKEFRDFISRGNTFDYGIVINAVILFLAVAAIVFFGVVKPLNMLQERRRRGQEPVGAAPPGHRRQSLICSLR